MLDATGQIGRLNESCLTGHCAGPVMVRPSVIADRAHTAGACACFPASTDPAASACAVTARGSRTPTCADAAQPNGHCVADCANGAACATCSMPSWSATSISPPCARALWASHVPTASSTGSCAPKSVSCWPTCPPEPSSSPIPVSTGFASGASPSTLGGCWSLPVGRCRRRQWCGRSPPKKR